MISSLFNKSKTEKKIECLVHYIEEENREGCLQVMKQLKNIDYLSSLSGYGTFNLLHLITLQTKSYEDVIVIMITSAPDLYRQSSSISTEIKSRPIESAILYDRYATLMTLIKHSKPYPERVDDFRQILTLDETRPWCLDSKTISIDAGCDYVLLIEKIKEKLAENATTEEFMMLHGMQHKYEKYCSDKSERFSSLSVNDHIKLNDGTSNRISGAKSVHGSAEQIVYNNIDLLVSAGLRHRQK